MNRLITASVVAAVIAVCTDSFAKPDKVAYELKVRCGKQVDDYMSKEYGDPMKPFHPTNGGRRYIHQSHYNAKLNACLYFVQSWHYYPLDEHDKHWRTNPLSEEFDLYDLNEGRAIAHFVFGNIAGTKEVSQCEVDEKTCKTKAQWDALVKPYLEE